MSPWSEISGTMSIVTPASGRVYGSMKSKLFPLLASPLRTVSIVSTLYNYWALASSIFSPIYSIRRLAAASVKAESRE
jgi:hypothetical protein